MEQKLPLSEPGGRVRRSRWPWHRDLRLACCDGDEMVGVLGATGGTAAPLLSITKYTRRRIRFPLPGKSGQCDTLFVIGVFPLQTTLNNVEEQVTNFESIDVFDHYIRLVGCVSRH